MAKVVRAYLLADENPSWSSIPWRYKRMIIASHKDREERFQLFIFFINNGMYPPRARYWVMWHGGYDASADRQMQELVNRAMDPHERRLWIYETYKIF